MKLFVDTTFVLLMLTGTAWFIAIGRLPLDDLRRNKRAAAGLVSWSLALVLFGGFTAWGIHRSPTPTVEGYIARNVQRSGSQTATEFTVLDSLGKQTVIHSAYEGPGIYNGERVRVRYVAFNGYLLELTALSPPYTGWVLRGSDGMRSCLVLALAGMAFGVFALVLRARPPAKLP